MVAAHSWRRLRFLLGRTQLVVGLAGAVMSLVALPLNSARATTGRLFMAVGMLLLHAAASVAYYIYAKHNGGDALWYYYDWYNWANKPFSLGTVAALQFTQFLKTDLGASYVECYIFYQSVGFCGIMMLMRSFQEIHENLKVRETILSSYLLFLPSMYFWTSGIGKDALLFFAISLCVWAVISFRKRIPYFCFALLVMVLFRAHIALVVVTALAAAALFHQGIAAGRKIGLLALTSVAAISLVGSVRTTLRVDVTDPHSIGAFLDRRSAIPVSSLGASAVLNAPFPERLASLLFRPFFFDATGIFGIVSSVENVGSVLLFFCLARRWRTIRLLAKRVFFIEFCVFFTFILILLLSLVYYNVGLGVRERVMVFPPLFCVFIAQSAMGRFPRPRNAQAITRSLAERGPQPRGAALLMDDDKATTSN